MLKADGIGSCGVIAAYDFKNRIGALAHIMLPGHSPGENSCPDTKYAADAIDEMIRRMTRLGAVKNCIGTYLVGGGNVRQEETDTICEAVITSINELLKKKGLQILSQNVGGITRRSISLNVESGEVLYSEGGEKEEEISAY